MTHQGNTSRRKEGKSLIEDKIPLSYKALVLVRTVMAFSLLLFFPAIIAAYWAWGDLWPFDVFYFQILLLLFWGGTSYWTFQKVGYRPKESKALKFMHGVAIISIAVVFLVRIGNFAGQNLGDYLALRISLTQPPVFLLWGLVAFRDWYHRGCRVFPGHDRSELYFIRGCVIVALLLPSLLQPPLDIFFLHVLYTLVLTAIYAQPVLIIAWIVFAALDWYRCEYKNINPSLDGSLLRVVRGIAVLSILMPFIAKFMLPVFYKFGLISEEYSDQHSDLVFSLFYIQVPVALLWCFAAWRDFRVKNRRTA